MDVVDPPHKLHIHMQLWEGGLDRYNAIVVCGNSAAPRPPGEHERLVVGVHFHSTRVRRANGKKGTAHPEWLSDHRRRHVVRFNVRSRPLLAEPAY